MKKATLTVSFDSEKLDALTYHMSKKDTVLQTELRIPSRSSMKSTFHRPPVNTLTISSPVRPLQNLKDRFALLRQAALIIG